MNLRSKEAARYLGFGSYAVDQKTELMIQESFQELEVLAEPKFVYRVCPISFQDDAWISIETLRVQSKDLCKNLSGCRETVVFGATLGTEVDRQLRKYEVVNIARAVVFQACAAAYLEAYCDEIQSSFGNEHTRPRFSPGYGDFSILHQKEILQLLDASKKIALTMTEGYMLSPSKSVTALIGIEDTKE